MIDILNEILHRLRIENIGLSDKQFSKTYLNRNPTYYAYIKSMNKEPSMDAMVSLWKYLRHEAKLYEHQLQHAKSPTQEYMIKENLNLYTELTKMAFKAISES